MCAEASSTPGASKSGQARLSVQLNADPGGIAADLQAPLWIQEAPREGKHDGPVRFVLHEEPAFQEKSKQRRIRRKIALRSFALVVVLVLVKRGHARIRPLDRDMEFVWTLKHLDKTSWQRSSSVQIKPPQLKSVLFQSFLQTLQPSEFVCCG